MPDLTCQTLFKMVIILTDRVAYGCYEKNRDFLMEKAWLFVDNFNATMFVFGIREKGGLALITISIIAALLVKQQLACEKEATLRRSSYVADEDYYNDRKIICSSLKETILSTVSLLQCFHRCVNRESCGIINYRKSSYRASFPENCIMYDVRSTQENCQSFVARGWVALVLPEESRVAEDDGESNVPTYKTCEDIYSHLETAETGVYDLLDGKHWCMMNDTPGCGKGGWTLAMIINGTKPTLSAESPYWTNNETYNAQKGIQSIYEEAKFPAFSLTTVHSVCVGMLKSKRVDWMRVNVTATSLRDLFKHGSYIETGLGRKAWKKLLPESSLQLNCNKEGFNVRDSSNRLFTRLGIIANQEDDCGSPDSFIAFGAQMISPCSQQMPAISCGNYASCTPDNGEKSVPAICHILIK